MMDRSVEIFAQCLYNMWEEGQDWKKLPHIQRNEDLMIQFNNGKEMNTLRHWALWIKVMPAPDKC